MCGNCYWFAYILAERFAEYHTRIVYFPVANHFACMIGDQIFDICGEVANDNATFYFWDDYKSIDATHAERIMRQCILKEED